MSDVIQEIGEALEAFIEMQQTLQTPIDPDANWFKKWRKRAGKAASIANFVNEADDIPIKELGDASNPELKDLAYQIDASFERLSYEDAKDGLIALVSLIRIANRRL